MTIRSKKIQQSENFKKYLEKLHQHFQFNVTQTTDTPHQEQKAYDRKIVAPEPSYQRDTPHLYHTLQRPPDCLSTELLAKQKRKKWDQRTDMEDRKRNKGTKIVTPEASYQNDALHLYYTLQRPPDCLSSELLPKQKGKKWDETTHMEDRKTNKGQYPWCIYS